MFSSQKARFSKFADILMSTCRTFCGRVLPESKQTCCSPCPVPKGSCLNKIEKKAFFENIVFLKSSEVIALGKVLLNSFLKV